MNFRCPAGKVRVGDIIWHSGTVVSIGHNMIEVEIDGRCTQYFRPKDSLQSYRIIRPRFLEDLVNVVME